MSYYEMLRAYVGKETLILPGAAVIIKKGDKVLLQKRVEGEWGLPGGLMEIGESFEETAQREVKEETGLLIELEHLHKYDIYSGKEYYVEAPNGDPYFAVTVLFYTSNFVGELSIEDEETLDLQFFSFLSLPEKIRPSHKRFLNLFYTNNRP
ncbi:NUDIX hydrolase [Salipaludibacillus agaradhaerens]|uniref:NUDIX hydrolase n=1 Tax=Salipaludibacillus agaradhaerens TaxID=76935 RepID=UPI00099701AB|nr:NUDIX domain-containing protein [Salipaludibacillus agaradhaerens]